MISVYIIAATIAVTSAMWFFESYRKACKAAVTKAHSEGWRVGYDAGRNMGWVDRWLEEQAELKARRDKNGRFKAKSK